MTKTSQNWLRHVWQFCCYICQEFVADGCMHRAAALAYTALLSLVPLMTVSFAVLSAFPVFKGISERLQSFVFENFVASSGKVVLSYIQGFTQQASRLSVVGFLVLIITAILVLFTAERTLNVIWKVHKRRSNVSAFLIYWSVLTFVPILAGFSFLLSNYITSLPYISQLFAGMSDAKIPILTVVSFVLLALALAFFYIIVPNCYVKIWHGLAGGVLAAILIEIAKWGFALYLQYFPTYKLLYGAVAIIPIFLIWIYLCWIIILLGAELSHALSVRYVLRPGPKLDGFTHAFRWLGYLWQAQQQGKAVSRLTMIKKDQEDYEVVPRELLNCLQELKLIETTSVDKFILARDFSQLSFNQLRQMLPWPLPKTILDKRLAKVLTDIDECFEKVAAMPLIAFYQ